MADSEDYKRRRAFFDQMLTVYGRKAVLECLADDSLSCYSLHLASSNRPGGILKEISTMAERRGVAIREHSREELARISKNARQDQGVALDVMCPGFQNLDDFLPTLEESAQYRLLALDGVTNPQNLGMIIRSATAGRIDGILWSRKGNAALGPLVIKASAGTVFKAPLIFCERLPRALGQCRERGFEVCSLAADAQQNLFQLEDRARRIFVLGNETEGVSSDVAQISDRELAIPMRNGVESLNVAVTAGLIAYAGSLA